MPAPTYRGKLADPGFRVERGQKAATARDSVDNHIREIVEAAPTLTAEQLDRLRGLLPAANLPAADVRAA